jgi:hypothetical protein
MDNRLSLQMAEGTPTFNELYRLIDKYSFGESDNPEHYEVFKDVRLVLLQL